MDRINGAGHVNNRFVSEDMATNRPPTEVTPEWLNFVQEELVAAAAKDGAPLGASDHQLADVLGARLRYLKAGAALPITNGGPIWHDDYNSIMTWQSFTANGANYVGYASVLVGGLLIDTQPTPRSGYVRSGVTNLNRAAYAALRGWAMHNGVMVAAGVWAAGTVAVKDNADGTTFTAFDVRGEFPRFWDDARGIDAGRTFGSNQSMDVQAHYHPTGIASLYGLQAGGSYNRFNYTNIGTTTGVSDSTERNNGVETRPRNVAMLASIKF